MYYAGRNMAGVSAESGGDEVSPARGLKEGLNAVSYKEASQKIDRILQSLEQGEDQAWVEAPRLLQWSNENLSHEDQLRLAEELITEFDKKEISAELVFFLLHSALTIKENIGGRASIDALEARYELACQYYDYKEFNEAFDLLAENKSLCGETTNQVLSDIALESQSKLISTLIKQNKFKEALESSQRVVALLENAAPKTGDLHPTESKLARYSIRAKFDYARAIRRCGGQTNLKKARVILEDLVKTWEQVSNAHERRTGIQATNRELKSISKAWKLSTSSTSNQTKSEPSIDSRPEHKFRVDKNGAELKSASKVSGGKIETKVDDREAIGSGNEKKSSEDIQDTVSTGEWKKVNAIDGSGSIITTDFTKADVTELTPETDTTICPVLNEPDHENFSSHNDNRTQQEVVLDSTKTGRFNQSQPQEPKASSPQTNATTSAPAVASSVKEESSIDQAKGSPAALATRYPNKEMRSSLEKNWWSFPLIVFNKDEREETMLSSNLAAQGEMTSPYIHPPIQQPTTSVCNLIADNVAPIPELCQSATNVQKTLEPPLEPSESVLEEDEEPSLVPSNFATDTKHTVVLPASVPPWEDATPYPETIKIPGAFVEDNVETQFSASSDASPRHSLPTVFDEVPHMIDAEDPSHVPSDMTHKMSKSVQGSGETTSSKEKHADSPKYQFRLWPSKRVARPVGNREITPLEIPPRNIVPKTIGTTMSGSTRESSCADKWIKDLEDLTELLRRKKRCPPYTPVKIAVIDTGIRGSSSGSPISPYWKMIAKYKDFVSRDNQIGIDNTGHGTNGVHLIFQILPEADVYVARVFDKEDATIETPSRVAEAIHWAMSEKVDIINMSFGFEDDDEDVKTAVKQAVSLGNILVFAAAANHGNRSSITFPARMQEVLHVFSTTGYNKVSQDFNPSASKKKPYNFAILGEAVSVGYLETNEEVRDTGTSIATYIASGIAGRILDFSRHESEAIDDNMKRRLHHLKSVAGISAVLSIMAEDSHDNGYECIRPWKLLKTIPDWVVKDAEKRAWLRQELIWKAVLADRG